MIDAIHKIDTKKHEIIFKAQLWSEANPQGDNIRLDRSLFSWAYGYASGLGYPMTASVFDKESLDFLLTFPYIPFVKIACNKDLWFLEEEVPRKIKIYKSISDGMLERNHDILFGEYKMLACSTKYPATIDDYKWYEEEIDWEREYNNYIYTACLSDHTKDLELYKYFNNKLVIPKLKEPRGVEIIEMHYALKGQTGLDVETGICKTETQLAEIL